MDLFNFKMRLLEYRGGVVVLGTGNRSRANPRTHLLNIFE